MFIEKYTGRKVLHNGYNPALTTTDENLADHSALISYTSTLLSTAAGRMSAQLALELL